MRMCMQVEQNSANCTDGFNFIGLSPAGGRVLRVSILVSVWAEVIDLTSLPGTGLCNSNSLTTGCSYSRLGGYIFFPPPSLQPSLLVVKARFV